ncbi:MAG: class II fructose-bisphosphatase [Caldilineales bacterium]|nr:class II fructose-bisphosphatase [Caldilineales bacterium]
MSQPTVRNLGLDLVRATEAAALKAGRWMGLGNRAMADQEATVAMVEALNSLDMDGLIVVGEEAKSGIHSPLDTGNHIGNGLGPALDVVVDPIDGTSLLVEGRTGAISVVGVAPRGAMWSPAPAAYMEKIVVDRDAAHALVPECMDAPAAWTLALLARVKKKNIRDLVIWVLDRPRHAELIEEIRMAGARVALRSDGDISGAILAAMPESNIDALWGIGGTAEGVVSACAVRALGGQMLVRVSPQSEREWANCFEAGLEIKRILTVDELIRSEKIFFVATGITDGALLDGVRYQVNRADTQSLVMRVETGNRRMINTEHFVQD